MTGVNNSAEPETEKGRSNFIRNIIDEDLQHDRKGQRVITRFPPEPNGFLHIGHAKAICLNFEMAKFYADKGLEARCHLRFDDTNPEKEDERYARAIEEDIRWLGHSWGTHLYYSSDYFEKLYQFALELIRLGKAYVCELSVEQIKQYRGDLKTPGQESPFRQRGVEENLELFQKMKDGQFADGSVSLRAKIDMNSPNMNMRDPVIYRIKKMPHQRVGNTWCIYPMYDYTHCLSDALEGITHSLCSLEFEDHRPLYDWVLDTLKTEYHPQQIEFARLNLEYTVTSKRWLKDLVDTGCLSGWDDPRMPTIAGMRRRGVPAKAIVDFCEQIGVTKKDSWISMETLEAAIREELGAICPRVFGVVDPIKVTITNWEEQKIQLIEAPLHPQDETFGHREMPFGREIYIERDDFLEVAPKKFFRLSKGGSVRLKYAYVMTCDEVIKSDQGEILELKCHYHQDTFAGATPEGMKKVKGIINWVSASKGIEIENRLYDRLFLVPNPRKDKDADFKDHLNPHSLIVRSSFVEPYVQEVSKTGAKFQFERQGYFALDLDSRAEKMVFNRIVSLKDTWAKVETQGQ